MVKTASPRLRGDELARPLDQQECGMALVEVPDRRLDAERSQGADSPDAQDELLAEAHLPAANVQDVGDRSIRRVVRRDVGVEQEDRHTADLRHPDRGVHDTICDLDAHLER
jgi:hypothetical protein